MLELTQKDINELNSKLNEKYEQENLPFHDFNINLQKKLKEHMKEYSSCKAYVLDIKNDRAIEILDEQPDESKPSFRCRDKRFKMPDMNNEINYYWLEYKEGDDEYRITMFMKELDRSTGNIHVIPGVAEKWKKRKDNSRASKTNIIEFDDGKLRLILKGKKLDGRYLISEVIGEECWDPDYKDKEEWITSNWNSKIRKDVIVRDLKKSKDNKDGILPYLDKKREKAIEAIKKLIPECGSGQERNGREPRLDWFKWLDFESGTDNPWFVSMFKIVYTKTCGLVILFNDMFVGEGEYGPTDVDATYSFNYEVLKKK